ncbi:amidase [Brenneria roseae subsp. roseae]|nr:amidase [Brenneria roseae subsp. roseae]
MSASAQTVQTVQTRKSALILIEFQNDWMAPTGGINSQFKDRPQFDESVANARKVLVEARRRHMEVIYVTMTLDPSYKVLGQAKYGLRAMMPKYKSFLGHQADIFPGFEPNADEYVIRERSGSSAFAGTTLDSYLRNNHIEDIYLMGYSLRQCVESTLRNAHDLGYNTNVIYDASAGFTREQQTSFVKEIAPFYGNAITAQAFLTSAN